MPASAFQTPDAPRDEDYSRCIRCGLCLNACPTFRVLGEELDSPRGRIYQVVQAAAGRIGLSPGFQLHMDRCLDCRACVTACPSGVPYGAIIERARAELRHRHPASPLQRLAFNALIPYPARLRAAASLLRFYQASGLQRLARSSGILRLLGLARSERLCPSLVGPELPFAAEFGQTFPAEGARRARVAFLPGCAQNVLLPGLNHATLRVLRRQGCEVLIPADFGCCGALHQHAGLRDEARALARRNIAAFERLLDPADGESSQAGPPPPLETAAPGRGAGWVGAHGAPAQPAPKRDARPEPRWGPRPSIDAIVVNAAGCGAALKEYPGLFDHDPAWQARAERVCAHIQDVTEFLDALGLRSELLGPVPLAATYQDPCHLAHAQRIRSAPRRLIAAVPGLELREMQRSDQCCGSAGIYNLQQPEIAAALLADRQSVIAATGAQLILTANPGCMLQLASAAAPGQRVLHVVELLDESHRHA